MPEFTEYPAGTPSWVDLGSPNLKASTAFYGRLFGWKAEDQGEQAGHYTMFSLRGKAVGAVGPLQPGQPPSWTTYVTVDDAEVTVKGARDAGATILMEPMDVMDAGRMAVLMDPAGAAFSIWQPNQHIGAQLANEPGTLCWNELNTRDLEGAIAFYPAVFGWEPATSEMDGMSYTEWKVDGRTVAGMIDMAITNAPEQVPPHWLVYFAVDDCDASVKTATTAGATALVPPTDIPPGRFSVLMDPQGATFALIRMSS